MVKGVAGARGPVEIRWNGVRGPVVGTALADTGETGLGFEAWVTIPDAPVGVSYLVAVDGTARALGRAAFEVTSTAEGATALESAAATSADERAGIWTGGNGDPVDQDRSVGHLASVGLLGLGGVMLVAASGMAATRRRRARAGR